MRTQTLHRDVDDRSWRLAPVDPKGWLTGEPVAASSSTLDRRRPIAGEAGATRRRRPRRTEAARLARERELARRRRRRQGRSIRVDHRSTGGPVEPATRTVVSGRRVAVADRTGDDGGYRIGRWGRLALTLLAAATLALITVRVLAALIAGPVTPSVEQVTVRPGDTLWSIAAASSPERDPRAVIDEIRDLNDLPGDLVRVGEVLRVPAPAG